MWPMTATSHSKKEVGKPYDSVAKKEGAPNPLLNVVSS